MLFFCWTLIFLFAVYSAMAVVCLSIGKRVKSDATKLAKVLYSAGARSPIKILRGSYSCVERKTNFYIIFSTLYIFLFSNGIWVAVVWVSMIGICEYNCSTAPDALPHRIEYLWVCNGPVIVIVEI